MTPRESITERNANSVLPSLFAFADMSKERMEEFAKMQKEFAETLQHTNEQWFDRVQSEANLVSQFAGKLTTARSIPEGMAAWQELTTRQFELIAEDGKHFLADAQKLTEAGTRLMFGGWTGKRGGATGT